VLLGNRCLGVINALAVLGGRFYGVLVVYDPAGNMGGLFRFSSIDSTWQECGYGIRGRDRMVPNDVIADRGIVFGAMHDALYRSTDVGDHWEILLDGIVKHLAAGLHGIYALTDFDNGYGVFRSIDSGATWLSIPALAGRSIISFLDADSFLLAADDSGRVWRSNDNGATWGSWSNRLWSGALTDRSDRKVLSLASDDQYIYAGTASRAVWRRPIRDVEDGVLQPSPFPIGLLPMTLRVAPNPAHSWVDVRLTLRARERVVLSVFDVSGREVMVPRAGELEAGIHHIRWKSAGVPPGCYFVVARSGGSIVAHPIIVAP
jgi:hypothetical protein